MRWNRAPALVLQRALSTESAAKLSIGEEFRAGLQGTGDEPLAAWLVRFAGSQPDRRAALATAITFLARQLSAEGLPGRETPEARAWNALVVAADRLFSSGVHFMGRLAFLTDGLLELIREEAHRQMPSGDGGGRRTGEPGDVLGGFAVSTPLREAVGKAVGHPVTPSFDALYEYDAPGSYVRPHLDSWPCDLIVHLLVEQTAGTGSTLSAWLPERPLEPLSIGLRAGESVLLHGRGTLHAWGPLNSGDNRILTAMGFNRLAERL